VAFSGGVDSTFLLVSAVDALGRDNVIAVTAVSETYTGAELKEAVSFARRNKIRHQVIRTKELENKRYASNPPERCYYCKKELFAKLENIRKKGKLSVVFDGTNYDDRLDVRHGNKAKKEFGVVSPLSECRITKEDIRSMLRVMGLSTHSKPSMACLASRIPHGTLITREKLLRVENAEAVLHKAGFTQVRVRDYGDLARIELDRSELKRVLGPGVSANIVKKIKKLGYRYVTVDLEGYRTGSMNPLKKR
jgi:uncharacterized protein